MIALSPLKKRIADFFLWINSRSLRERILIFCTVQLVVLVVVGFGLLTPRWQLKQELVNEVEYRLAKISTLTAETGSLQIAEKIDPDNSNRELLKKINLQSDELRATLSKLNDVLVKPEEMALRLQAMIHINGKLQLVLLNTLPVDDLMQGKKISEINPGRTPTSSESTPESNNPLGNR